jgi:hypothetical protein
LTVWKTPLPGRRYVIGVDPAEGNPNSDESAAVVLDAEHWGQVALLAGRVEPGRFAGYVAELGVWYQAADVLVERNNHGHLVLRTLQEDGRLRVLNGCDDRPHGRPHDRPHGRPQGSPLQAGALDDTHDPLLLMQRPNNRFQPTGVPPDLVGNVQDASG